LNAGALWGVRDPIERLEAHLRVRIVLPRRCGAMRLVNGGAIRHTIFALCIAMTTENFAKIVMKGLLALHIGIFDHATAYPTHAYVADATVVRENRQEAQNAGDICGWIGVAVSPMTAAFAQSLGMAEPYGAIFDQPEAGSPAAAAGIEQGDVLTAINGSPLMRASDFARIISAMAPDTQVYLNTSRDGEAMQVRSIRGLAPCWTGR
jgi:membrane-associated protease RseP (regulator of RpoE activity)